MEISLKNNTSFKGYDARKLSGLFVTDSICAKALKSIIQNNELDIFMPSIASKSIKKEYANAQNNGILLWAQDYLTILPDKKSVIFDTSRDFLKRILRASADGLKKKLSLNPSPANPHLRGGNFFICNNVNEKNKLLISESKLIYPKEVFKKIYNVDEVCPLPKLDYHLDLFIRPLENGTVLVANNEETRNMLNFGIKKLENYICSNNLSETDKNQIKQIIENIKLKLEKLDISEKYAPYNPKENTPKLIEILEKYGFTPVKVPGTYFYLDGFKDPQKEKEMLDNFSKNLAFVENYAKNTTNKEKADFAKLYAEEMKLKLKFQRDRLGVELQNFYENNFINAIVSKNKDGKLTYITNDALLDYSLGITPEIASKTGFSTKQMFIESLKPYIDAENIHFIPKSLTERLFKYMGGIHCTCAEIPAN